MATDGVKIIDGDLASDTYWGIIGLHEEGASLEKIHSQYPFPENDGDDFDHEIYTTAYALAIWEIGRMSERLLQEVQHVIQKGACVHAWTEECGPREGKARQKELDKFWKKINKVNTRIHKVKKFTPIKNFVFEENDVLVFQLEDQQYYATVLITVVPYGNKCSYEFGRIVYHSAHFPSLAEIQQAAILVKKMPSLQPSEMQEIVSMGAHAWVEAGGIDLFIQQKAEESNSFVMHLAKIHIDHTPLRKYKDRFQKIGQLAIHPLYKRLGQYSMALGFDEFVHCFREAEEDIKAWKLDVVPIKDILEVCV